MSVADMPLTIDQMRLADTNYADWTITNVEVGSSGESVGIAADGGYTGFARSVFGDELPRVGQVARIYGFGRVGSSHYGLDIDGKNLYWKTPLEREADRATWLATYDREKRERYARDKTDNDAKIAVLPAPLRLRMERFRRDGDEDSHLNESYELFACTEGAKIAEAMRKWIADGKPDAEAIRSDRKLHERYPNLGDDDASLAYLWFLSLPYKEQVARGLDEGHSGNTFAFACRFALALLRGEEL